MRVKITIPCVDTEGIDRSFSFYVESDIVGSSLPFELNWIGNPVIEICEDQN